MSAMPKLASIKPSGRKELLDTAVTVAEIGLLVGVSEVVRRR